MSLWEQLGQDINGETPGDNSGYSVSINGDGTIVAIGAPYNNGNGDESGHTRVYQYNETEWVQLGQDIDGDAADEWSGSSVSINSDGTIVAIGAYLNDENGYNSGHTRVYKYNGTTMMWEQLGEDINGESSGDLSGSSVSINSDGTIVAIGARSNDGNGIQSGHTRVYQYNETEWVQLGEDIYGENAEDNSGYSVSINGDGTIVAIGANMNDGNGNSSGHTRIYKYNGTTMMWEQLGEDIDGENAGDESGYSVSINGDGTIVAIGARYNDGNGNSSGHTRVYKWDESSWNQLGSDIDGEATGDQSGYSVSINGDGTIVAIGARYNDGNGNDSGHTRVYQYNETEWVQLGEDIDGEADYDRSGWSVSINSDGYTVAIGAPYNDENGNDSGHTRIYKLSTTLPQEPTNTSPVKWVSIEGSMYGNRRF
jgi:hypothetical protein